MRMGGAGLEQPTNCPANMGKAVLVDADPDEPTLREEPMDRANSLEPTQPLRR